MSYRELRDFTEHMKALGCPSSLSINGFRQPNFPLVASLLLFLLHRYDPTLITAEDISTQQARIAFIQSITALLLSKCHVKLSMKQLYRADGYAVKEMLKLSTVLYAAMEASQQHQTDGTSTDAATSSPSASGAEGGAAAVVALDAFKEGKALASELIDIGERLSSLLQQEPATRPQRDAALAFVESISGDAAAAPAVERSIRRQMTLMQDNIAHSQQQAVGAQDERDKLRSKLERREGERDRLDKRWKALRRVRPAFMDEYEREEKELRAVYSDYVERLRNVHWLETEMQQLRTEEEDDKRETERRLVRMQKRLREEEMNILRGADHAAVGSDDEDDEDDEEDEEDEEEGEEGEEGEGDEDETEDDGSRDDEKRPYERKERKGDDDSGVDDDDVAPRHRHELDDELDEDEDEPDDDDDDGNEKRFSTAGRSAAPPRGGASDGGRAGRGSAAIVRSRDVPAADNRDGARKGGGGGRGGGGASEPDGNSESELSTAADDDYF